MKKALIITYYWPPSGGAAVQRWLKFSKYLRQYGWEPIVYTAKDGEYPQYDPGTEKEVAEGMTVLRQPVLEPHTLYKKLTGRKKQETLEPELVSSNKKSSMIENFAIWVRGNFFIPDARKFWIKPSVKYLKKYLQENPVDVIISTNPPQSMHLIALELAEHFNIPWLADFRDPWTKVDYFDQLKLSKRSEAKHKALEQKVLVSADMVLTVSPTWAKDFKNLGAKNVALITNGYDADDLPKNAVELDSKFSIAHIGNLSSERVHEAFFIALANLCADISDFKKHLQIKLIGKVAPAFLSFLDKYELTEYTSRVEAVSHKKAVEESCKSQVLLLLLGAEGKSQGRIPLKVFEYLAAKRPIIGMGPVQSDVAKILRHSQAGEMLDFNDEKGIQQLLQSYFEKYQKGELRVQNTDTSAYSRENLSAELVKILEQISKAKN